MTRFNPMRIKRYKELLVKPYTKIACEIIDVKSLLKRNGFGVASFDYPVCKFEFEGQEYVVQSEEAIIKKAQKVGDKVFVRMYEGNVNSIVIDQTNIYSPLKMRGYYMFGSAGLFLIVGIFLLMSFMI